MYIDTHIHLSHRSYDGSFPYVVEQDGRFIRFEDGSREILISLMKDAGIGICIEPGISGESNEKLLALAEEPPGFLYPAAGIHPTRAPAATRQDRRLLSRVAAHPSVVAIGETGLDYHYERKDQHRLQQMVWFIRQILLAHRRKLPLILHIRKADRDAVRILRLFRSRLHGGVCHCFTGGSDLARVYTEELGLMLGIGGTLLNPAYNRDLEQAIRETPLEYLLLETDGPYILPPRPEEVAGKQWRKTRNTSLIIPAVAARIAELKVISVEEVENTTTENAKRVFRIS